MTVVTPSTVAAAWLACRCALQIKSRRLRAEHVQRARRLLDGLVDAPHDLVRAVAELEADIAQGELWGGS